jgi:calpain-15
MLAERPALIERLFSFRLINDYGIYKVKICKMGEWQNVTVDDLIPCLPKGPPIFASCYSSEIWAMIIEKAFAKLSGGYY